MLSNFKALLFLSLIAERYNGKVSEGVVAWLHCK